MIFEGSGLAQAFKGLAALLVIGGAVYLYIKRKREKEAEKKLRQQIQANKQFDDLKIRFKEPPSE